jgi:hypothetical protein
MIHNKLHTKAIDKAVLGLALLGFLAAGPSASAAGKPKSNGHGKAATKVSAKASTKASTKGATKASTKSPTKAWSPGQDATGANGASDAASTRTGAAPNDPRSGGNRAPLRESVRQESRIEFDERMLKGQSAAGVIYLFQRSPSDWKSIVEVPDSFRARTVNVVAPGEEKK